MRDYAADYRLTFTLRAQLAALILIDLQHATADRYTGLGRLLAEQGKSDRTQWRFDRIEGVVLPNVSRLIEVFRRVGGVVAYVTLGSEQAHYEDIPPFLRPLLAATSNQVGSPTHRLLPGLEPAPGEIVVNKRTASAFLSTDLEVRLRTRGVEQLVLAGVSTNSCVESTARDAADLAFSCLVVEDACAAASETLHRSALANFARLFGRVASTDEVVEELGGSA